MNENTISPHSAPAPLAVALEVAPESGKDTRRELIGQPGEGWWAWGDPVRLVREVGWGPINLKIV